jgi:hypothetical protein
MSFFVCVKSWAEDANSSDSRRLVPVYAPGGAMSPVTSRADRAERPAPAAFTDPVSARHVLQRFLLL